MENQNFESLNLDKFQSEMLNNEQANAISGGIATWFSNTCTYVTTNSDVYMVGDGDAQGQTQVKDISQF